MCVDRGVASRPSEGELGRLGDVHPRLRLSELLGETKVDDVYSSLLRPLEPNREIFRFDVSMYVVMCVHKLDPAELSGK